MSDSTKIEWAANADGTPGASWNPIRARNRETGAVGWFCVHESEGCRNCYAERLNAQRFGNGVAYKAQNESAVEIFLDEKTLLQPLSWKKPRTIFVCSMSDLFGAFAPGAFVDKVFAIAALCPQHTFIVLTKRARRMRVYFEGLFGSTEAPRGFRCPPWSALLNRVERAWVQEMGWEDYLDRVRSKLGPLEAIADGPLPNLWLGVSAEDQKTADARIPDLLATPAALRFVSLEPLLGPIDLTLVDWNGSTGLHVLERAPRRLDWVIVGGESGPHARPMHPDWARSLRDQCAKAGVPFFFKQWGEWAAPQTPKRGYRTESEYPGFNDHLHQYVGPDGSCCDWASGPVALAHKGCEDWRRAVWVERVGKTRAGRLLDGAEHNDRPPLACQRSRS